jgi:riboflavin biosynthesis pyrimidine reductase
MADPSDAVMVGARTAAVDDPSLLVRDDSQHPVTHQPLRVVLCRESVPTGASLLRDDAGEALVLVPRGTRLGRDRRPSRTRPDGDV